MKLHNRKVKADYSILEKVLMAVIAVSVIGLGIYVHYALQNMSNTYAAATKISESAPPKFHRVQSKNSAFGNH